MSERPFLKQRLREGRVQVGAFVMAPSPALIEMFGYGGFDFVIVDREHGASTLETLENQIRAAEVSGIEVLVRIPNGMPSEILSVLEAGASGVVVPHVRTAEQARQIASAAHYPPYGTRGFATTTRAGRHGNVTREEHLARARERTLVVVQIEDADAIDGVDGIAATQDVDVLFIGPADLSMSMGFGGDMHHPEVVAAIDRILEKTRRAGQAVPACFAPDRATVQALERKGVRMICVSGNSIVSSAIREAAQELIQG